MAARVLEATPHGSSEYPGESPNRKEKRKKAMVWASGDRCVFYELWLADAQQSAPAVDNGAAAVR